MTRQTTRSRPRSEPAEEPEKVTDAEGNELKARDYSEFWAGKNPTPEERAHVIVKRLEQFIREGRTERGGIAFKRWQELALHEVSNAILDAEKYWRRDQRFITRGLAVGASALITVGMWGTVLAAQAAPDRQTAAIILVISGAILFAVLGAWGIRRLDKFYQLGRRRDHFRRIFDFDRQLAQLDVDLEKRLKELEASLEEMTKGKLGDL